MMQVEHFNTAKLPPDADQALTALMPEDPEAVETFAVWLYDGVADIGLTMRVHPHGGASVGMATILLPDGRILNGADTGILTRGDHPESEHVRYEVVEPFRRWRYRLADMPMAETTEVAHATGEVVYGEPSVAVSVDFDGTMVAPAWIQGSLLPEAAAAMTNRAGLWIAGRLNAGMSPASFRYDQALAATGTITVGQQRFEFTGYGHRGHVRGVRKTDGFASHTWMGAVFPETGRAFGLQCHRGHGGKGGYEFSESYVFADGTLHPTRVIYAPPLSRSDPHREFEVQLACDELGLVHLTGHDTHILWTSMGPLGLGSPPQQMQQSSTGDDPARMRLGLAPDAPTAMSQAVAVYDWGGDPGYGMNERSG
jgi:hypothetical protein